MALQMSRLDKAIQALARSIAATQPILHDEKADPALQDTVRAGVIQHYEVAFELCWKFMQRWLRENRVPEDADNPRTRNDLFRLAARYNLISDPTSWFEYGEARNLTSHTYEEKTAIAVYLIAEKFLADATYLLKQLEKSHD